MPYNSNILSQLIRPTTNMTAPSNMRQIGTPSPSKYGWNPNASMGTMTQTGLPSWRDPNLQYSTAVNGNRGVYDPRMPNTGVGQSPVVDRFPWGNNRTVFNPTYSNRSPMIGQTDMSPNFNVPSLQQLMNYYFSNQQNRQYPSMTPEVDYSGRNSGSL